MMDKEKLKFDLLDCMVATRKGMTLLDILNQLTLLYGQQNQNIVQGELLIALNELTTNGYAKTFKIGALDAWKITEEGEIYLEGS